MKSTHTPPRSIRVSDDLWSAATVLAAAEGRTVTDIVVKALRAYVARAQRKQADEQAPART